MENEECGKRGVWKTPKKLSDQEALSRKGEFDELNRHPQKM